MSKYEKLRTRILDPQQHGNITLDELCHFVERIGFTCRPKPTGHKVFTHPHIPEIINLQPGKDGKAKRYQIRQVADLVLQYQL